MHILHFDFWKKNKSLFPCDLNTQDLSSPGKWQRFPLVPAHGALQRVVAESGQEGRVLGRARLPQEAGGRR